MHKTFDEWIKILVGFHQQFGHYVIPTTNPKYKQLRAWVNMQRKLYKNNMLLPYRAKLLKCIGFEFDPLDKRWHENIVKVQSHKITKNLQDWMCRNKRLLKHGLLEEKKSIHVKRIVERKWIAPFENIQHLVREGRTEHIFSHNTQLLWWFRKNRTLFDRGELDEHYAELFAEIRYCVFKFDVQWNNKFSKIESCIKSGEKVDKKHPLWGWLKRQQVLYENQQLNKYRASKLQQLLGL